MKLRTQNEDAMKVWIAAPAAWLMLAAPGWAQDSAPAQPAEQAAPAEHQHEASLRTA